MKVLLVRTPRLPQAVTLSDFMFSEPLGLEMVYTVIENQHTVEIFDMMCDPKPLEEKLLEGAPDVVALTSLCIDVNSVIRIAQQIKAFRPEIVTVVGGTQALLNPQSFMHPAIDHIFKFTTRQNLIDFYSQLEDSKVPAKIAGVLNRSEGYLGADIHGINEYIVPNRQATQAYRQYYSYFGYQPSALMQISQGCQKACTFCLRWRIEGKNEVTFDLESIRRDLNGIEEATIMLFDNDIVGSSERIDAFLDLVASLDVKKNFIAYASVEGILKNVEALKRFKLLGLKALLVGYETFSEAELKTYNKQSSVENNFKAAELMKDLGIDVWASYIAHPDWSKKDFSTFRKYVKRLSPQISSICPLTPFPNLPLYATYKDRLLFAADDYEKWSFGQVIIRPSQMSLSAYYYEMLKTNLYINLSLNQSTEMLQRFGAKKMYQLSRGSVKATMKYVKLMIKSRQ